jgi:TRAP transporter TAXI family solute receptor
MGQARFRLQKSALALAAVIALAVPSDAQDEKPAPQPIRILAGPAGSTDHALGAAMAKLIASHVADSRASVRASGPSFERVLRLDGGDGELALVAGHVLAAAYAGIASMSFKAKLKNLSAIAALQSDFLHIVAAKDARIAKLADLKGKRVSVGLVRSDTELATRALLAALGIKHTDFGTAEYLSIADAAELLKRRELDAFFHIGPQADRALRALAANTEIILIAIPPETVTKLGAPFRRGAIPANSYPGQATEVATALVPTFLATRADLPEARVFALTKVLFDNLAALAAAEPAARAIRLESAPRGLPVPLHKGAAKYFRQKGVRF